MRIYLLFFALAVCAQVVSTADVIARVIFRVIHKASMIREAYRWALRNQRTSGLTGLDAVYNIFLDSALLENQFDTLLYSPTPANSIDPVSNLVTRGKRFRVDCSFFFSSVDRCLNL